MSLEEADTRQANPDRQLIRVNIDDEDLSIDQRTIGQRLLSPSQSNQFQLQSAQSGQTRSDAKSWKQSSKQNKNKAKHTRIRPYSQKKKYTGIMKQQETPQSAHQDSNNTQTPGNQQTIYSYYQDRSAAGSSSVPRDLTKEKRHEFRSDQIERGQDVESRQFVNPWRSSKVHHVTPSSIMKAKSSE